MRRMLLSELDLPNPNEKSRHIAGEAADSREFVDSTTRSLVGPCCGPVNLVIEPGAIPKVEDLNVSSRGFLIRRGGDIVITIIRHSRVGSSVGTTTTTVWFCTRAHSVTITPTLTSLVRLLASWLLSVAAGAFVRRVLEGFCDTCCPFRQAAKTVAYCIFRVIAGYGRPSAVHTNGALAGLRFPSDSATLFGREPLALHSRVPRRVLGQQRW